MNEIIEKFTNFAKNAADNAMFLLAFVGLAAAMIAIAYIGQKLGRKKRKASDRILSTKTIALIALFSALAALLMLIEMPVPFAASFYKLDISDLPGVIGGFIVGPVAGVLIQFIKVMIHALMPGTSTAFVGELANFLVGSAFILPASIMYQFCKNKKMAIAGCIVGTLAMSTFGTWFNAAYLIPTYAGMMHTTVEAIVSMGTAVNANIKDVTTFVLFSVMPLNLLKGSIVSVVAMLVYKPISKQFHKFTN